MNWVKVYSSTILQNVEILRHLLRENGIEGIVMNRQDSAYVTIGEIDLMVKGPDVLRAKRIITEAKL
ncbi:MAG: DUF2007 domain-containing protein [Flavobacteriales bacterium]|nr:DUF2007 domain-containing protein [Flavobacteriales bacterium]